MPEPALACCVLSLRDEPGLVATVMSLLAQEPRPELVVVNSGGGDPEGALAAAGIGVPVVDVPERRSVGAVRNLGVAATRAPNVAWLAADCIALPGWAAGRLAGHDAGATAVTGALAVTPGAPPAAHAQHLLLHHRRRPDTRPAQRLIEGLSITRTALELYGPFREDLAIGEDTEYGARLLAAGEPIAWGEGVVSAHHYEESLGGLVRDQFKRGRAAAVDRARNGSRLPRQIAARNVRNIGRAARAARPEERAALPLLVAGGLASAAGALSITPYGARIVALMRPSPPPLDVCTHASARRPSVASATTLESACSPAGEIATAGAQAPAP